MEYAEKGRGYTRSNPVVGALIIDNDGKLTGVGYHEFYGGPHAEVNAIKNADKEITDKELICTLEPCDHTGKTGPCTEAIIDAGIKKVTIGALDPNPMVRGSGIEKLRKHGIEVSYGILEREILEQNRAYVKYIRTGMPYVTMKIAMSKDGKIASKPGERSKITGAEADRFVHQLRARVDGIISGIGTVLADDPLFTARLCSTQRQPVRLILDSHARTPIFSHVVKTSDKVKTLLFLGDQADSEAEAELRKAGVSTITIVQDDLGLSLEQVLRKAAAEGLIDLMVEAGQKVSSSFLKLGLVDRIELLVSDMIYGNNGLNAFDREASQILEDRFIVESKNSIGSDTHLSGRIKECSQV